MKYVLNWNVKKIYTYMSTYIDINMKQKKCIGPVHFRAFYDWKLFDFDSDKKKSEKGGKKKKKKRKKRVNFAFYFSDLFMMFYDGFFWLKGANAVLTGFTSLSSLFSLFHYFAGRLSALIGARRRGDPAASRHFSPECRPWSVHFFSLFFFFLSNSLFLGLVFWR